MSTSQDEATFIKRVDQPGAARAEAAGLAWLREASSHVAEVVAWDRHSITTTRLIPTRPTARAARLAGQELARIHRAGAPAFGAPPPNSAPPYFIGTQEQTCTPSESFAEFYPSQRVEPFARAAHEAGNMSTRDLDVVLDALAMITRADPTRAPLAAMLTCAPARIHGDLWSGNLMFTTAGPVFIDPAAHGGHPVTDLAMLELFGAPYLHEIYAGYQEVSALPSGWAEALGMHQLHPLAVHTLTHGAGYAAPLVAAARSTRELLGDAVSSA